MDVLEWLVLACGAAAAFGLASIIAGTWRPPRLLVYVLLAAFGLALGVAIARLIAYSLAAFVLVVVLLSVVWRLRKKPGQPS